MPAIIFDMDGVLIDSELHWRACEKNFIRGLITAWDKKDQSQIVGLGVDEIYQKLTEEYSLKDMSPEAFRRYYNAMALPIYRDKTSLIPGAKEFIERLERERIPLALASSARRSWVQLTLKRHHLESFFSAVVSGEDVTGPSKPDPGIFLKAAELLGQKPAECIVIEDSNNGVLAAKRAGMFCVGMRNGFNQEQDLSEADVEVAGLEGLTVEILEGVLRKNPVDIRHA